MSRKIKDMLAADLRERIGDCRDFLVIDDSQLTGVVSNGMRLKLRRQSIRLLGIKNSLARRVFSDLGLDSVGELLSGPSTLAFGGPDIVALSKEITKWAKDVEKLQIKGGVVEGKSVTPADVDALSKSPSRQELLGKIVMLALSPGGRLAGTLLAAGGTVVGQVKSVAERTVEPVSTEQAS